MLAVLDADGHCAADALKLHGAAMRHDHDGQLLSAIESGKLRYAIS